MMKQVNLPGREEMLLANISYLQGMKVAGDVGGVMGNLEIGGVEDTAERSAGLSIIGTSIGLMQEIGL